jgi:TfoX/Sxy family transcriptional regulator of competence genes
MAYDEKLTDRIRQILGKSRTVTEKKMFGGLCFLVKGKMVCGVLKDEMVVKIGAENHEKAVAQKHVRPFDFTGKPMVGIIYVGPGAFKSKKDLAKWVAMGRDRAENLSKEKKK